MNYIFDQINQEIAQAQRILLISHQKPDGDACGSVLGMLSYLQSIGKQVGAFVADKPASYFSYLPNIDQISTDLSIFSQSWDVAIFLDSSDTPHTKADMDKLSQTTIINIDHHISNKQYGKINYVDAQASSACEIVYNYLTYVGFAMDKRTATCLLSGIISDTGGFKNSATSLLAMDITSNLIRAGASVGNISNLVGMNKSINGLKLWGEVLSRLKTNAEYDIAYTYIKHSDFKKFNVSEEELDGFIDFLNVIVDAKAAILFRLESEQTRVSMRTTKNDVDLSQIASSFGGGGHKKAAGFTLDFALEEQNGELLIS
ncbi:MAG: DHH family phosphoesterase [Patescibacteria group bacterium]